MALIDDLKQAGFQDFLTNEGFSFPTTEPDPAPVAAPDLSSADLIVQALNAGTISPSEAQNLMADLILAQGGATTQADALQQATTFLLARVPQGSDAFNALVAAQGAQILPDLGDQFGAPGAVGGTAVSGPVVGDTSLGSLDLGDQFGAPGAVPSPLAPEELFGGAPAFGAATRGLGINTGLGGGAFGRFIGGRFRPADVAFSAQTALGQRPADVQNAFRDFVSQNLLGGGIRARAGEAFQGLLDLSQSGFPNALQSTFTAPEGFGQFQRAAQLGRSALGSQIGGFALSRLAPSIEDLVNAFQQGPTAANAAGFLPFLQQQLGIRQVANPFTGF